MVVHTAAWACSSAWAYSSAKVVVSPVGIQCNAPDDGTPLNSIFIAIGLHLRDGLYSYIMLLQCAESWVMILSDSTWRSVDQFSGLSAERSWLTPGTVRNNGIVTYIYNSPPAVRNFLTGIAPQKSPSSLKRTHWTSSTDQAINRTAHVHKHKLAF